MIRPVPGAPIEEQPETVLLRMLIFGEARGESARGMLAVGANPFNRRGRGRWRQLTLSQIILQRWQYSCFNHIDPNRPKLLRAYALEPLAWARCDAVAMALEVVSERTGAVTALDLSNGATHYVVTAMWNTDAPGQWYGMDEIAVGHTVKTAAVERHVFAKAA